MTIMNTALVSILFTSIITGTLGSSTCGANITARQPLYIPDEPFSRIHVLSFPTKSNLTKCKWTFSHPSKFVLNIVFVNITIPSSCADSFVSIRKYDAQKRALENLAPYCGKRRLPGFRINGTVEIELHRRNKGTVGTEFAMTIRVEASSGRCGGIFNGSSNGMRISADHSKFIRSTGDFFHCLWYFELPEIRSLTMVVDQVEIATDSSLKCTYYSDFISVRSWNGTTGMTEKENFYCNIYQSRLPLIYSLQGSNNFIVTIHLERQWGASSGLTSFICLFASEGLKRQVALETTSTGNATFNLESNTEENRADVQSVVILKPFNRWSNDNYNVLLDEIGWICSTGIVQAWKLVADRLHINNGICRRTESKSFSVETFSKMFVLQTSSSLKYLKGFQMLYFPKSDTCGGLFSLEPGKILEISSPSTISGKYPSNINYCKWVIIASGTTKLNISVQKMDLEECSIKFYDYVEIYDNFRRNQTLRYKMCKKPENNLIINGDANIHFHSDYSKEGTGFKLSILATEHCGGTFYMIPGESQRVTSPNFRNGTYPAYSSCRWLFFVNETTYLNVSFVYVNLESCSQSFYDYIEVYENFNQTTKLRERTCVKPKNNILISGNMTVLFKSDGLVAKSGFDIEITAKHVVPVVSTTVPPKSSSTQSSVCCRTDPKPTVASLTTTTSTTTTSVNATSKTKTTDIAVKEFDKQSSSNNAGMVAGVVIGALLVIGAVVAAVVLLRRRKKIQMDSASSKAKNITSINHTIYTEAVTSLQMNSLNDPARNGDVKQSTAAMETENPYYLSNPEYGNENLYSNSDLETTEAVYATATEEENVYLEPPENGAEAVYSAVDYLQNTEVSKQKYDSYDQIANATTSLNGSLSQSQPAVYYELQNENKSGMQNNVYDHLQRQEQSDTIVHADVYDHLERDEQCI